MTLKFFPAHEAAAQMVKILDRDIIVRASLIDQRRFACEMLTVHRWPVTEEAGIPSLYHLTYLLNESSLGSLMIQGKPPLKFKPVLGNIPSIQGYIERLCVQWQHNEYSQTWSSCSGFQGLMGIREVGFSELRFVPFYLDILWRLRQLKEKYVETLAIEIDDDLALKLEGLKTFIQRLEGFIDHARRLRNNQ